MQFFSLFVRALYFARLVSLNLTTCVTLVCRSGSTQRFQKSWPLCGQPHVRLESPYTFLLYHSRDGEFIIWLKECSPWRLSSKYFFKVSLINMNLRHIFKCDFLNEASAKKIMAGKCTITMTDCRRNTVRLLTHILCKPSLYFFQLFISNIK